MFKRLSHILVGSLLLIMLVTSGVLAYDESPMLKEQVEEGKLPVVEERLPEEPLVVEPRNEIGQYGGTWRRLHDWEEFGYRWETLVKKRVEGWPKIDSDAEFAPNIAKDWEINEDLTKFTFHLRKGIKWSDGEPLTTEDMMFWYEDIILNKDYRPGVPGYLTSGGEAAEVSAPDKWTIVFEFVNPNKSFMMGVTKSNRGPDMFRYPKHYYKQFHPKYADEDELQKKIDEAGLDNWYQLIGNKDTIQYNPDKPVIGAWKLTTERQEQLQILVRNPYYWKVDPEGNQLPYIDKQQYVQIDDREVQKMKYMSGEIDFGLNLFATSDFPILQDAADSGDYRVLPQSRAGLNGAAIALAYNQNYIHTAETEKDKEIGELMRNVKFRRAVSIAIDRDEINEFVYLGKSNARQSIMNEVHPAVTEEMAKRYTEYDPEKAEKWLDEIGMEKGKDGWRTLPSGESFQLNLPARSIKSFRVDGAQIMAKNLQDIGINAVAKTVENSLWLERAGSGEYPVMVTGNSGGMSATLVPFHYFPTHGGKWGTRFAPEYGLYYDTDGEKGVKPDGDMAKLLDLYEEIQVTLDKDEETELISEVMDMHSSQLWMTGFLGFGPRPLPASNRMKNLPDHFISMGFNPPITIPETWYIEE